MRPFFHAHSLLELHQHEQQEVLMLLDALGGKFIRVIDFYLFFF
jgi:hypothetical protein